MRTVHPLPTPGAFFEARYPFVRDKFTDFDADGPLERDTWKPGTRAEMVAPDDSAMVADAEGSIVLTVVAVFKPGKFPTRVFFTRRWRDPDGTEFGKDALRIATVSNFYALTRGYRHEYEMSQKPVAVIAA